MSLKSSFGKGVKITIEHNFMQLRRKGHAQRSNCGNLVVVGLDLAQYLNY